MRLGLYGCYNATVVALLILRGVASFPLWGTNSNLYSLALDRRHGRCFSVSSDSLLLEQLEQPDLLISELHAEGLGNCHGMLHASGVRRLSDIKSMTPSQLTDLKSNEDDHRNLLRVVDELNLDDSIGLLPKDQLSTLVDGAFEVQRKAPTDSWSGVMIPQQDFAFEVVCAENEIFKGRLFTEEQCHQISRMAEFHAYDNTRSGWSNKIYTLTDEHLLCKDVPGLISVTKEIFNQLKRELYTLFPGRIKRGSICFENPGEPHLVKYKGQSKGTELHKDNSEFVYLTINAALSVGEDFVGGGTYIKALDRTIHLEQGEMLIHLGNLEHAGAKLSSGVRRLLIAFLACEWEDEELNIENTDEARTE
jgi:hypothetical protein